MSARTKATKPPSHEGTKGRGDQSRDREGANKGMSIADFRLSIGRVACVIVMVTVISARADEVNSRAQTIDNANVEPTFTECIARALTVDNANTEPIFREAISRAQTVNNANTEPALREVI